MTFLSTHRRGLTHRRRLHRGQAAWFTAALLGLAGPLAIASPAAARGHHDKRESSAHVDRVEFSVGVEARTVRHESPNWHPRHGYHRRPVETAPPGPPHLRHHRPTVRQTVHQPAHEPVRHAKHRPVVHDEHVRRTVRHDRHHDGYRAKDRHRGFQHHASRHHRDYNRGHRRGFQHGHHRGFDRGYARGYHHAQRDIRRDYRHGYHGHRAKKDCRPRGRWERKWCPPVYRTYRDRCGAVRRKVIRPGRYERVWVEFRIGTSF